jgi:hypothetical protein
MDANGSQKHKQQISGYYSGPINELLQPHGRGEMFLKGAISRTFYGTWENGKLVTPLADHLADDPQPVADDVKLAEQQTRFGDKSFLPKSSRYTINKHNPVTKRVTKKPKHRIRYNLGDACRTPRDMIICRSREKATESASLLKKWDGAFVKRSCGIWTYAILIERSPQPLNVLKKRLEYYYWATAWEVDPRDEVEDSMLFAIDGDGSTKIIPKHTWAKYVRRVHPNPVAKVDARGSSECCNKTTVSSRNAETANNRYIQKVASVEANETTFHSSIESYIEAEFGNLGDAGTLGGRVSTASASAFLKQDHLMSIIDSERGSESPSSVYEE